MSVLDVSRETIHRLERYQALLLKWNPRINLVAPDTLKDAWDRHLMDSAQVFDIADPGPHWVDLGSGGGFPGMVCAVLAMERSPGTSFTLIESDGRKCAFLRTVARDLELHVEVLTERVEAATAQKASNLSARALAPLSQLLSYAERHLAENGVALFQKGRNYQSEVQIARQSWHFECEAVNSKTEEGAAILKISDIAHV